MIRLAVILAVLAYVVSPTAVASKSPPQSDLVLYPGTAVSGSLITVNGCGYPSLIRLVITSSSGDHVFQIAADSTGCFYNFTFVSEGPGDYTVTSYDAAKTGGPKIVQTPYRVLPALT